MKNIQTLIEYEYYFNSINSIQVFGCRRKLDSLNLVLKSKCFLNRWNLFFELALPAVAIAQQAQNGQLTDATNDELKKALDAIHSAFQNAADSIQSQVSGFQQKVAAAKQALATKMGELQTDTVFEKFRQLATF